MGERHRNPALWAALPLLAACGGSPATATPEQKAELLALSERQMEPFLVSREVRADRVELEISANFYSELALPGVSRGLHEVRATKQEDRDVYEYVNRAGGDQVPLRLALGGTRFVVRQGARVTVLGTGAKVAISARAEGKVEIREAGRTETRDAWQVVEGVHTRR